MILPKQVPLVVYEGETFWLPAISFVTQAGTPIILTGYTAIFTLRQTVNSNQIALQVTSSNYININGPTGQITIVVPSSAFSSITAPFDGVWDLFIFSPTGVATRLLGGPFCYQESVYQ